MPQKIDFQPLTGNTIDFQPIEEVAEKPSMLSSAWHAISDPLTEAPSRFAKSIGEYINPSNNYLGSHLP